VALALFVGCSLQPESKPADGQLQPPIASQPSAAKPDQVTTQLVLKMLGYRGVEGVTNRQMTSYRRVFGFIDRDRDGRHSKQEYVDDGTFMSRQARQGIFNASDSNQDGFVSQDEYIENRIITDEAKEIFAQMDANRDGRLTAQELVASGRITDKEMAESTFAALDTNNNDELTVPEYLRVWGRWARR
jgi:Ca2+-binding EF-hand superfamily protein